jgi:hypothetical protein
VKLVTGVTHVADFARSTWHKTEARARIIEQTLAKNLT